MLFNDDVNTDVIIPSQYLEDSDPTVYCYHVMEAIRPTAYEEIQKMPGAIFVAGKNFGTGSSREQAPDAIKHAGVKLVLAESFASIFFRNAINVGLPILEVDEISQIAQEGDQITVNLKNAEVKINSNKTVQGKKLTPFLLNKLTMGGLIPELQEYVKANHLDY